MAMRPWPRPCWRTEVTPPDLGETGMWRFRDWLPLEPGPIGYPLAVGDTPLVAPRRLRLELGMPNLFLKDETRGPSASNKDRATALVIEQATRGGARAITCASTGNVAVSTAIGAAAAGLEAVIFVPATVSPAKLQLMLWAGATVVCVERGYEAAFELSREAARAFGWHDRNTGVNPATIEAKKTVGLEIHEQLGNMVPDVIVAPVGDGPTCSAVAKAFRELMERGITARVPRLIGVRPANPAGTVADGIAVVNPVMREQTTADVEGSGGAMLSCTDDQFYSAMDILAARAGIMAEPAGAAAFAGLEAARQAGLVQADETTVVLVTGSALKTPQLVRVGAKPIVISGRLAEVKEKLGQRV